MSTPPRLIPIYTTRGDLGALLAYPYLFNAQGEWIGWVNADRDVYSVHGHYTGWLSDERRILRKRCDDFLIPRCEPPPQPRPIRPPAHVPLPPQMPELTLNILDVLDEEPELLPTIDYGELHQDLD